MVPKGITKFADVKRAFLEETAQNANVPRSRRTNSMAVKSAHKFAAIHWL